MVGQREAAFLGERGESTLERELRRLKLTTILLVFPVFGGLILATPALAAPCTGAVDTPDSTTCTNSSSGATLDYVIDNAGYGGADFTLRLNNHDVNAAAGHGINFSGVAVGNDGTITLDNDSDVVSGAGGNGINSSATSSTTTINVNTASSVTGALAGISATSSGGGAITVNMEGDTVVTGNDGEGIHVFAVNANVEVTTGANSAVTGLDGDGIGAFASSGGNVVVKTKGTVNGSVQGIDAEAVANGGTVLIETAAAVTGNAEGIDASAAGNVTVKAGGDVTGSSGINAVANEGDVLVTTAAVTTVTGTSGTAITASASSTGNVVVQANSTVTGRNRGIDAFAEAGTVDITTGAETVSGTRFNGIEATASGKVTIGAGGDVSGGINGIIAQSTGTGDVAITTSADSAVTGGLAEAGDGINASATGTGRIRITNNADTRGSDAGIDATSALGATENAIQIINKGTVANLSGETNARAITTQGGATKIDNSGNLIGTVSTESNDDFMENKGFWNMAYGTSDFGAGGDEVVNSGTLLAADDPTEIERTYFNNLEEFTNSGLVSQVDGQAGDLLQLVDGANYTGDGGRLAVDAVLGPDSAGGLSDQFFVLGASAGKTLVHVNVVGSTGINTEGIPVVFAIPLVEGVFDLDGPLNVGFFAWDLRPDDGGGGWYELFTSGVGAGSYEFAAGITAAQDIWQQSIGTLMQRQADLRSLLGGTSVTPVADFSEPVAPTPVASITPGFWFRGVGAYVDRDDEHNGIVLDRQQTIWGGLAGFDFGTQDIGDALMFGLFGGYLTSNLDFDETNSEWIYDGPTVGAYVTYVSQGFYADATVKADFLDIDIDANDLAPADNDADTDAFNIGGRIDTGYRLGFGGGLFAEPQATIAVVHTEIDDVDIFGGAVEFDDETNVKGRLGLRLGHETTASNGIVYSGDVTASVWEDFSGDNDVTIAFPGLPSFGVSDDPGDTLGDVALGVSVAAPEGWSGFIRGNYLFGEDYEAVTGNAGVRFAW